MPGSKPEGRGEIESVYFAEHDLRGVFSRPNVQRRREGGHTLRKFLTEKQDKKMLSKFVKIREAYAVMNNSDAVAVWVQMQLAEGADESEFHEKLLAAAKNCVVQKRDAPFAPEN